MALLYKQLGQLDEAVNHFLQATLLDPRSTKAAINLARLYFQQGRVELARDAFEQVRVRFPEYDSLATEYLQRLKP